MNIDNFRKDLEALLKKYGCELTVEDRTDYLVWTDPYLAVRTPSGDIFELEESSNGCN